MTLKLLQICLNKISQRKWNEKSEKLEHFALIMGKKINIPKVSSQPKSSEFSENEKAALEKRMNQRFAPKKLVELAHG